MVLQLVLVMSTNAQAQATSKKDLARQNAVCDPVESSVNSLYACGNSVLTALKKESSDSCHAKELRKMWSTAWARGIKELYDDKPDESQTDFEKLWRGPIAIPIIGALTAPLVAAAMVIVEPSNIATDYDELKLLDRRIMMEAKRLSALDEKCGAPRPPSNVRLLP